MNHPATYTSATLTPATALRRLLAALSAAVPALVPILLIAGAIAFGADYLGSDGPELIAGAPITASDQIDCVVFCEPPATSHDGAAPALEPGHVLTGDTDSGCVMFCAAHTTATAGSAPPSSAEPSAVVTAAGAVLTGFGRL